LLYLANPSTTPIRQAMTSYELGCIITPRQGNRLPREALWGADNGCGPGKNGMIGQGFPGYEPFLGMLQDHADYADDCLFAVAPDVVGDADGTLKRSKWMLEWIRYAGYPAALAAQDGLENLTVPWDDFDALFIGGSTAWKLGAAARRLIAEANRRNKWVHMGRVNTLKRLRYAATVGCHSVDGTFLTFGPDINLPRLLRYLRIVNTQPTLWASSWPPPLPLTVAA